MRLIDADALMELLQAWKCVAKERGAEINNMFASAIIAQVDAMPTIEPEPQWMPCSEKLPKKEELHYWVCTDTGYQCQCRWTNDVYGFGASDRWDWKIFDIPQYQKVVAWRELPEPYWEEGGDD